MIHYNIQKRTALEVWEHLEVQKSTNKYVSISLLRTWMVRLSHDSIIISR